MCDCKLKSFRDFVVHKKLLTTQTICLEPERLADKAWTEVNSQDFACKPEVEVSRPKVLGYLGENATLECKIIGNPVPAVKWVLNGRIIQNNSSPLNTKNMEQTYVITEKALAEGKPILSSIFIKIFITILFYFIFWYATIKYFMMHILNTILHALTKWNFRRD